MHSRKLYNYIVNKNEAVRKRYTYYKTTRPDFHKKYRIFSWAYLWTLFTKYQIFKKRDESCLPDSSIFAQPPKNVFLSEADKADIVSFDMFDTLIFRRVNLPSDVFSVMALDLDIIDFVNLRINAEGKARSLAFKETNSSEVNIYDIYKQLPSLQNRAEELIKKEFETEQKICFANPFMKEIFDSLVKAGKKIIITSDMYWPSDYLDKLLTSCGYSGYYKIFVSNEYGKNKYSGKLQAAISSLFPQKKILHIGDSAVADVASSKKIKNWKSLWYKNISNEGNLFFRPYFRSLAGSAYCALANIFQFAGINDSRSKFFMHGYVHGGFLSYGYCQFIDNLTKNVSDSKILFTARDSETFYNIYKTYFNSRPSQYFYCSRESVLKSVFPYCSDIFFDIMFFAKTSLPEKVSMIDALSYAELSVLSKYLGDYGIKEDDLLDVSTAKKFEKLLYAHQDEVIKAYSIHKKAALSYIKDAIEGYKQIYFIDLGWRGTIFAMLKHLIETEFPDVKVFGTLLGSVGSRIAENLIETQTVFTYSFSHADNLDLQITPRYIMLAETLFSSEHPSTIGYGFDKQGKAIPLFGASENSGSSAFVEMKAGMYEFCKDFHKTETLINKRLIISGRDAYLPLFLINFNYLYNITLFESINASDMSASKAVSLKKILKRFGY